MLETMATVFTIIAAIASLVIASFLFFFLRRRGPDPHALASAAAAAEMMMREGFDGGGEKTTINRCGCDKHLFKKPHDPATPPSSSFSVFDPKHWRALDEDFTDGCRSLRESLETKPTGGEGEEKKDGPQDLPAAPASPSPSPSPSPAAPAPASPSPAAPAPPAGKDPSPDPPVSAETARATEDLKAYIRDMAKARTKKTLRPANNSDPNPASGQLTPAAGPSGGTRVSTTVVTPVA